MINKHLLKQLKAIEDNKEFEDTIIEAQRLRGKCTCQYEEAAKYIDRNCLVHNRKCPKRRDIL